MKALEQDAQELAQKVVSLWKEDKSEEAIELCDSKISELLERYKKSTVSKDCQKIFRKAISQAAGQTEYRYSEPPVCFFAVPREVLEAVNEVSRDGVEAQRDELIPITEKMADSLLETAVRLLNQDVNKSQSIYEKSIAVAILTGRRIYAEVLHYAQFEKIDDFTVNFTGQAKGGIEKREEAYPIPVLGCNSEAIIKAQNEIREYISSRPWYNPELTDKELSGKLKKQVQQAIVTYIDPIFDEVRKAGYELEPIIPKDLRKIYATLAWKIRNRKKSAFTAYAATILGHNSPNKVSGKRRRDTKTSESYEKFIPVEKL